MNPQMELFCEISDLATVRGPTHLAIGVFDGLHLGHQAVIGSVVRAARRTGGSAVVATFAPHPIRALRPKYAPRLLMAPVQKSRLLEELGVDAMLTIHFTLQFSKTSPDLFIQKLRQAANSLIEICVGADWRFGANRFGEIGQLRSIAQSHGIELTAVPPVLVDGRPVSSTRVRAAIARDNLNEVVKLLGRPFDRSGVIVAEAGALWAKEIQDMESRTEDPEFVEGVF
jgi:riboflavin kinase / FMN adenylyltransferase